MQERDLWKVGLNRCHIIFIRLMVLVKHIGCENLRVITVSKDIANAAVARKSGLICRAQAPHLTANVSVYVSVWSACLQI